MKVYVAGAVNTTPDPDVSVAEYDAADGSAGWTANHGDTIWGVATDATGNVYIGGFLSTPSGNKSVRKYSSTGTLLWSIRYEWHVEGVAADRVGNVYVCSAVVAGVSTRKYDTDGTAVWSANHGAQVLCIAVDASGNVYTGGASDGSYTTRKYNSAGSLQWSANHGASVYGIAVDASGNVYTAGASDGSYTVRKYDSGGTLQWSVLTTGIATCVAPDSAGNVYVCGGQSSPYVRKYNNSSGTQITTGWAKTTGFAYPSSLAVDSADNVYVAGRVSSSKSIYKYNSAGTLQWSANQGETVYALALYEPPPPVPGLPIAVSLGIPDQEFAYPVPALALALALAVPSPVGGLPLTPPDFAATGERVFYRAYLTGEPALLEIPIASIQCRRRAGESTWLSVIAPGVTRALATRIQSLLPVAPSLLIYCGTWSAAGVESFGELLRATLTETDYTMEATTAPLTLTARVQTPSYSAASRTLVAVMARGRDKQGRHLARAAVDPLLRPGDTVSDGVSAWVVAALEYEITPSGAWMDVTEVG